MIIQRFKALMQKKYMRRGSLSIEFVFLVPLFLFMMLVIWQVAVAGMAVIQTQSAVQDAVRVASITGDEVAAMQEGRNAFGNNKNYKLDLHVNVSGNNAVATASTKIKVLFMDNRTITYNEDSTAPIVHD